MTARRFVWVTDIPTPYRVHQLRALDQELQARGIDFEVLFMARTVRWRSWTLDAREFGFPHRFARGIHPAFDDYSFHVNPGIAWSILRHAPTWLMVGGAWWFPSAVLAIAAAAARAHSCRLIIGAEANLASRRFPSGPVASLRQLVWRRADAYLVPGRIARDTLAATCGTDRPFLPLPNVVDEDRYGAAIALRARRGELRRKRDLGESDRVLLWPARLVERYKGILRFLQTIRRSLPASVRILLAGDGPDRPRIERWLAENELAGVRLLGHQSDDEMVELFALSDAMLLPSLSDANPLSVVEALWAGLPIFVSDRCGNWPEALDPGRNGWVVDPDAPEEVRAAFEDLVRRPVADLERMGAASSAIATERFSTRASVAAFVDALERDVAPRDSSGVGAVN